MRGGQLVDVFLGGMDERPLHEPGTARHILNMVRDQDGVWRNAPGAFSIVGGDALASAFIGLFWFQPHPNVRYLVYERQTSNQTSEIGYIVFPGGTTSSILTGRRLVASGIGATIFVQVGRWLYLFSPVDGPVRWDGNRVEPVGFTGLPPTPRVYGLSEGNLVRDRAIGASTQTEENVRGVGEWPGAADTTWKFGWGISLVNRLGNESPVSELVYSNGINSNPTTKRAVKLTTQTFPEHVFGVKIWRTKDLTDISNTDGGEQVYLHSAWHVAHGFVLYDHKPDSELVIANDPDSYGQVPAAPRAAAFWQNRMWLAVSDGRGTLRYSVKGFVEQFPEINALPVGSLNTGETQRLYPIPDGLVVLKESGIYIIRAFITDNGAESFRAEVVAEGVGCAAPKAVEWVPGKGLMFLDITGPMLLQVAQTDFQVTELVPLGPTIRRTWRRVGNLRSACSVYNPELNEVWFNCPEGGNVYPQLGIVLHLGDMRWSVRYNYWPIAAFARYRGAVFVASWDDTADWGVQVLTYAANPSSYGVTFECSYETNWTQFPEHMVVTSLEVLNIALGDIANDIQTQEDRIESRRDQADDKGTLHHSHEREYWGVGVWGSSYVWHEYEPAWSRTSLYRFAGRELLVKVSGSNLALAHMRLRPVEGVKPQLQERG